MGCNYRVGWYTGILVLALELVLINHYYSSGA